MKTKLIVVRPSTYAPGYMLAKQIGAEVFGVLTDPEAAALGLVDNTPRDLSRSMTRLLHAARACADGAPWARPKRPV